MMKYIDLAKDSLRTDFTWNRLTHLTVKGARALPEASVQYALGKFPIIGWLPQYNYRWIINDIIAGLTIGLMLIPQGLSYAKIATIPVQYGLMSSWAPSAIYAFMGTTKDLSTGPTSLISLLTAEIIESLHGDEWSPVEIASAVAMMMGIYGMVIGFLKLGFLLEFISLPILSGFISAVAITIILNQMDSLLGEPNVGDGTATQIRDIFQQLPQANGYACAIGFTGILLLTILDQAGKRWGKKNRIIWFLSITRAFIALVIFTGVGYAANRSRGASDNFLFEVAKVQADGQEPPKVPSAALLSKVASRSIAVFVGSAVEHTAIARAFAVRNNYVTDQSQELTYYGVTNVFNSFFHAMGVGGAMSRTAVNSACNVKSPLSGFVTTAVVLVSIFKLVGTLYWIPKATLAAIIITAVWPLMSPPSVFYGYWRTSLADFISSMIAFWVSLFVSTELGIAAAVGFNIVYVLLRQVFAAVRSLPDARHSTTPELPLPLAMSHGDVGSHVNLPPDVRIFTFTDSLFFPNAYHAKHVIIDTVKTMHAPIFNGSGGLEQERNWSVTGEKRIAKLRRRAGITDATDLPPIRMLVLDFGRTNHIDVTACTHLKAMVKEIKMYGGASVEVRFANISEYVRQRFERAGWTLTDGWQSGSESEQQDRDNVTRVFDSLVDAVLTPRRQSTRLGTSGSEKSSRESVGKGRGKVSTKEQV
ncbi:sulfate transporter family-domain-containing protein [Triangularia verruculosa]|uniref:Sulfate transporter family-domain-containing protein n=1 Tax=Triangularia verruculosa TaxID=2587418 RepID=A0AAN7ANF9_9PEZI|nr:sulfate transporter family-domain-containing protein [Triangularia verruculosa]